MCLPVTLTSGFCLLGCFGGNPLLLTSCQVLSTSCYLPVTLTSGFCLLGCFGGNPLLLTSSHVLYSGLSLVGRFRRSSSTARGVSRWSARSGRHVVLFPKTNGSPAPLLFLSCSVQSSTMRQTALPLLCCF